MQKKRHHSRKSFSPLRFIAHLLSCLAVIVLLLLVAFFGALGIICRGPSTAARDLFVNTVTQTSAAGFLAHIYYSDEEVQQILASTQIRQPAAVTDTAAVQIQTAAVKKDSTAASSDGITVEDISGTSFHGKLMSIQDPSRVSIYTISSFDTAGTGKQISDIASETGSVAAMNAGGFYDPDGRGHGGMPLGAVIRDGVLVSDYTSDYKTIIGFDADHKLIVGDLSADAAIKLGIKDGITFGPALVINGQRVPFSDNAGGLNPRSAIGQKQDGTILLLVIDGRQPHSLGASFKDLCDVMLDHGAVNAGNLDGGSSSLLYYQGKQLNTSASMIGLRPVPTAILVK